LRGELEIKASRSEIAVAFPNVPPEAHTLSIRLYIRVRNVVVGLTTAVQPRRLVARMMPQRPTAVGCNRLLTVRRFSHFPSCRL
jgi:hypothetical protein